MTVKELKAAVEYFNNFDPIKAAVEYFNNFDPIKYATNKDEAKKHRDVLLAHAQATIECPGWPEEMVINRSDAPIIRKKKEFYNAALTLCRQARAKEIAERPSPEELADYIYRELNFKGAGLGNASKIIIAQAIISRLEKGK
jgi:hypothetical protein